MTIQHSSVSSFVNRRTMGFVTTHSVSEVYKSLSSSPYWEHAQVGTLKPVRDSRYEVTRLDTSCDISHLKNASFDEIDDSDLW